MSPDIFRKCNHRLKLAYCKQIVNLSLTFLIEKTKFILKWRLLDFDLISQVYVMINDNYNSQHEIINCDILICDFRLGIIIKLKRLRAHLTSLSQVRPRIINYVLI